MLPYRIFLTLAAPAVALRLARDGGGRAERLGKGGPNAVRRGPVLWLHGASNGELTSARGLIRRILARLPNAHIIVTCNTETGRDLVRNWGLKRVSARLAPLDYRATLRRFIAAWQPDALILLESELWPNRIDEMARLGRPVLVVGARMSDRSARRWARLPGLIAPMLGQIDYLSAQDTGSRARFAALGLDETRIGPVVDLKSGETPQAELDNADLEQLSPLFPRAKTLLAASTHEGEERVVLMGFARALAKDPDLRLIVAPRHPRRAPEIAEQIDRLRLGRATRSEGELPGPDRPVYLADTMGEMALFYELAGISFVGGSLVDRGGHTPFEPAAHGSALLHGPHVANFAKVFAALDDANAARTVKSADEIAGALATLDAAAQARMARTAREVIADLRSSGTGLDPILSELARLMGEPALATPAPDEGKEDG